MYNLVIIMGRIDENNKDKEDKMEHETQKKIYLIIIYKNYFCIFFIDDRQVRIKYREFLFDP